MLGDTAVAINETDSRYLDLHGKSVQLPLMDRPIPIILDDLAESESGTGVVKVTPAHDLNDFECGCRHKLPLIRVIDETGHMTQAAGPNAGHDRIEARRRVVADLVPTAWCARALHAKRRPLRPLQDRDRTTGLDPMVCQDEAAGGKSHRRGRIRTHSVHPRKLVEDLLRVDVQHSRLVCVAAALVGPSYPRLALPGMR